MKIIDLRSDTVTQPTPAMREAMYRAEVGDDVFGEDPTVNRLEEVGAEMMGKEAALFVASGTMGNLVSLLAHCQRGDEVIVGDRCHTFLYEVAGAAGLGGIQLRALPNREDGTLDPAQVEAAIRGPNIHFPPTRLVCLENTHNRCGGAPLSPEQMEPIAEIAKSHSLALHLDGARIFNAAVSLGVGVKELTKRADSVMFCLSKGLSAPVGSMLAGPRGFIDYARRIRKALGGGMRQVGVLAAPGIIALTEMVGRLGQDHARAKKLASAIAGLPGIRLDPADVETNIIIFGLSHPRLSISEFIAELRKRRVLALALSGGVRFVTHKDIDDEDVERAIAAFKEIFS